MVDLVAWFRAVLDDDEAAARKCLSTNVQASMLAGQDPPPWVYRPDGRVVSDDRDQIPRASTWPAEGAHIALHDPEQVLADIAAKRSILDAYTTRADLASRGGLVHRDPLAFAVRTLASAYRHRPGWNTDWE